MIHETSKKVVKCSIILGDVYFLPTQELLPHPVLLRKKPIFKAKIRFYCIFKGKFWRMGGVLTPSTSPVDTPMYTIKI